MLSRQRPCLRSRGGVWILPGALAILTSLLLVLGASAQVAPTGTLTGSVLDPQGAAVVGAKLHIVDDATGTAYDTVSGPDGHFTVGSLRSGTYTVTITMDGFKKGIYKDVKITVGMTSDLPIKLELGPVSVTVEVVSGQEVLETQSTAVGSTIVGKSITQLPFTSRDTLDLAILMPGAQTTGRPRATSFVGLPKGAINITYDGINVQDSVLKSNDGFFTTIRPRVDDIEEFSISTAAQGAEQAGEGAVQIRFVSKRGSNEFHGGVWWYHRNDFFNANYYFNNLNGISRQVMRLNEYGYKVGGPILKDKLFFFTDFDFYSLPQSQFKSRTILTTPAQNGIFTYPLPAKNPDGTNAVVPSAPAWATIGGAWSCTAAAGSSASGQKCSANLYNLASFYGFTSTPDSVVKGLLDAMATVPSAPGVTVNTNTGNDYTQFVNFNNTGSGKRKFPDFRFDYNISKNHSLEVDYHYSHFAGTPDFLNGYDMTFPVAPFNTSQGSQISNRNLFVGAWRWAIGSNKSNEFRFGVQSAPLNFFPDLNLAIYPQASTNLGGVRIRPNLNLVTQPLLDYNGIQGRNGALAQMMDNLGWTHGNHSLNFGFSMTRQYYNDFYGTQATANLTLGVDGNDPAATRMFASGNLPLISDSDLGSAQGLYGMLAGRVTGYAGAVNFDPVTRQFKTGQNAVDKLRQTEFGFYGTDSWRLRPTLTFTYGLRWEYQGAPTDLNNQFFRVKDGVAGLYGVSGLGNMFKPGVMSGETPFYELNNGRPWINRYLHAFAPSAGIAWQPGFENSIWKAIFGAPGKTVVRAGFSISYSREGLNGFLSVPGGNPGYFGSQFTNPVEPGTSTGAGDFDAGSVRLQSLNFTTLAQDPSSFTPFFQQNALAAQSVNAYDPNLRPPRVGSWSLGIQRELTPSMVLEARYVGNHGVGLWRQINLNEVNIFENGFLTEFLGAQSNLAICRTNLNTTCLAAEKALGILPAEATAGVATFANLGLSGQVGLPIMTAAFTGSTSTSGASQANSFFRSSSRITNLDNGVAGAFANALTNNFAFWQNWQAAGYPSNLFVVNPDTADYFGLGVGSYYFYNGAQSTYHALQLEFRRRPSKGLTFNANYTWSKSLTDYYADSSVNFVGFDTLRDPRLNKGLAPFDLRHAIKVQLIYELPFGPGRKWSSGSNILNRLIEGWEINTITRWQTGRVTRLLGGLGGTFNQNDPGILLKGGLTPQSLQSQLAIRYAPGKVYWVPANLLDSSQARANSSFLQSCNLPGEWCGRRFLTGPGFFRADWSLAKTTRITERVKFEIRAEFLNAFNNINFLYGGSAATTATTSSLQSTTFGRMTSAFQDISTTDDPGGRIIQLVGRINF